MSIFGTVASRLGRPFVQLYDRFTSLPARGVVDRGPQVFALTVREARVTRWSDGRAVAVSVSEGIPARLSVTTLADPSELLLDAELPGAQGARGLGWAADGSLWIGTQPEGRVFRWLPGESRVTEIGRPTGDAEFVFGIAAAADGRMFLGTYPDAVLVEHHPEHGFRALHRFRDGAQYVRSIALDAERGRLWLTTSPPHQLWWIDLATGERTAVPLDPPLAEGVDDITVTATGVAFGSGHVLRLVDADTGAERTVLGPDGAPSADRSIGSRGLSPELDGRHWFTAPTAGAGGKQRLAALDPRTGTVTATEALVDGPAIGWGVLDGTLAAVVGNYWGRAATWDAGTGALAEHTLAIPPAATRLHSLTATELGDELLVGAYINGTVVRIDLPSPPTHYADLGQVEAFLVSGDTLVTGSYPNGLVTSRSLTDPTRDVHVLAELKASHHQVRPWALVERDGIVHLGTAPAPGHRGGVIARVPIDGSADALVRDGLVPGQCCASLVWSGDALIAGSSRRAGEGMPATEGTATLVRVDPDTLEVLASTPAPGGRHVGAVTALLDLGDRVLGLADDVVFALDPEHMTVIDHRLLPGARAGVNDSGALLAHPDGSVYVLCGERLHRVDPRTLRGRRVALPERPGRLAMTPDGVLQLLTRRQGVLSRLNSWDPRPPRDVR